MERDIRPTVQVTPERRLLQRAAQIAKRTRIEDSMTTNNLRPTQRLMETRVGH